MNYINEEMFDKYLYENNKEEWDKSINKLIDNKIFEIESKSQAIYLANIWINELSIILTEKFKMILDEMFLRLEYNTREDLIELIEDEGKYLEFVENLFQIQEMKISDNNFTNYMFFRKDVEMNTLIKLYFLIHFPQQIINGELDNILLTKKFNSAQLMTQIGYFLNNILLNNEKENIEVFNLKNLNKTNYINFSSNLGEFKLSTEQDLEKLDLPLMDEIPVDELNQYIEDYSSFINLMYKSFINLSFHLGSEKLQKIMNELQQDPKNTPKIFNEKLTIFLESYNDQDISFYISNNIDNKDLIPFQLLSFINKNIGFQDKINLFNIITHYLELNKENISRDELKDIFNIFNLLAKEDDNCILLQYLYIFAKEHNNKSIIKNLNKNPKTPNNLLEKQKDLNKNLSNEERTYELEILNNYYLTLNNLYQGKISKVIDIIENKDNLKFDLNKVDMKGYNFLMIAILLDAEDLVDVLLKHNVNPNITNFNNQTPLDLTIQTKNLNLFKRILDYKKNVDNVYIKAWEENNMNLDDEFKTLLFFKLKELKLIDNN
jgi:hypothetical protein